MSGDMRVWYPAARCHFLTKHAAFHTKEGSEEMPRWRCSWCEKMLSKFEIVGQSSEGPSATVLWGYDEGGKLWKLSGDERWGVGAWQTHPSAPKV